jgi:UDP-glucose 4-epimerase
MKGNFIVPCVLVSLLPTHILVTGCAGFIGSHLCERLLAEGYSVTGVDALTGNYDSLQKRQNLAPLLDSKRFRFVYRELLDTEETLLQDAEVIFHLAARPGVRNSWGVEFENYVRYNILSTQYLLECAGRSRATKRIVFASSSSIYGDAPTERAKEDQPKNPVSPYGITKLAGEHLCWAYAAQSGIPVIALRLFTVYGPRQRPDMAFHRLIHAALTRTEFVLYGDGDQRRDFTYVQDVVGAFLLAAKSPETSQAFNIAGGGIVSMNEAVSLVEDLTGVSIAVERVKPQSGDVRHTGADLSRSHDILGYKPQVTLREGLNSQVAHVERTLTTKSNTTSATEPRP